MSNNLVRFCLRSCAVFFVVLFSAGAGVSQTTPLDSNQIQARVAASEQIHARIVEMAHNLKDHPRLKNLTQEDRENAVAFVVGNTLFVLLHELAHAAIADLEVPVLGREEDAADEFALVRMIWVGQPSLTACSPTQRGVGFSAPDEIEKRESRSLSMMSIASISSAPTRSYA